MIAFPAVVAWGVDWMLLGATRRPSAQIGRTLNTGGTDIDWLQIGGVFAGLGVLAFLGWLAVRWYNGGEPVEVNNPRALFRELVRAHGLGPTDLGLLREIANWHKLPDPAELFLQPHRFQSPEMIAKLRHASEIANLHNRLFGNES